MLYRINLSDNSVFPLLESIIINIYPTSTANMSAIVYICLIFLTVPISSMAMPNKDCMECHNDADLESESGNLVGVNQTNLLKSVHSDLSCTDCHNQTSDFEDIPHFTNYQKVKCEYCHDEAVSSFNSSFHGVALHQGEAKAPNCCACHGSCNDPHSFKKLDLRSAQQSCRQCHADESFRYDSSVHKLAADKGEKSPGCTSCHKTHSSNLPPSVGAVNKLCEQCHPNAMEQVRRGGHDFIRLKDGKMSCSSCHDIHSVHKPDLDSGVLQKCQTCHPNTLAELDGSVHEELFEAGMMNCLSCHRTHQVTDAKEIEKFNCGECHDDVEQDYRDSAHRLARLHGDQVAATCADCHEGHKILSPSDSLSTVHRMNIPNLCGECHSDKGIITSDFVRLPISLARYTDSVHGDGWKSGSKAAVCNDCHGTHSLQSASNPNSSIYKMNLATTCGKCHVQEATEYNRSIHGRALAHGITDSPSCTDCHDEHLIYSVHDPRSGVNPQNQASETCAGCHEDPEMAARYGLPPEVIESYRDSYHGWAIKQEGKQVATCMDCHNTHDIRSLLDPTSSIHPNQVVATCARCHENSNAKFAASYVHILASGKRMAHDWVRIIYIILIVGTLGFMILHNLLIFYRSLLKHRKYTNQLPSVKRMTRNEVIQHAVLTISFVGLAITGFALRFPDAWWVQLMATFGLTEEVRRISHRLLAIILVVASVYHVYFMIFTARGRKLLWAILPVIQDAKDMFFNLAYYLGLRKERVVFGRFDYTQKVEYWALIWGTVIMSLTGFILWFPDIATIWLPSWVVRVCEVIHFYEAILAVAAIVVWHFFFEIVHPDKYPMSWTWITGKMPKEEWEHHHGRETPDK